MSRRHGFTLIELILVLAIVGLLAFVASPRLENLPTTRAYFALRQLQSDVRYAQLLAIESQKRLRIVFDIPANQYRVEKEDPAGVWSSAVHPATKGNYTVQFGADNYAGVQITAAVFDGNSTVIFDSYGAPFDAANAALTEPAYLDLNSKYRLNFHAQTGKVEQVTL